jgi:hypothetical protein
MKSFFKPASLLVMATLTGMAWAADPWVSVPSTVDLSGRVVVKGLTALPLTNVTVRFAHPQAAPIDMVVQAASSGAFSVSFQPLIVGSYTVTAFDSAGRLIGGGNFSLIR